MKKLLHKEELDWKGKKHDLELYESDELPEGFTNQCQAVPFVDENNVVLFKHIDGYYSLPGGTVEEDESFGEALKREVMEESACEILNFGLIGFVKDTDKSTGKVKYQLRYWALVKPLGVPIHDPDGKAIGREVVNFEKASEMLGWGERWQVLFNLAKRKFVEKQL